MRLAMMLLQIKRGWISSPSDVDRISIGSHSAIENDDWKYLRGRQGASLLERIVRFQYLRQVYPLQVPFASDRLRLIVLSPSYCIVDTMRFDFNISILPACGNEQRKEAMWKRIRKRACKRKKERRRENIILRNSHRFRKNCTLKNQRLNQRMTSFFFLQF